MGNTPAIEKYVLITGASSGIGEEFAYQLAEKGYNLILTARREDRLQAVKNNINANPVCKNVDVIVISADLQREDEIRKVFEKAQETNLYMVINNAGFGECGDFTDTSLQKELNMIDINVRAMHMLFKLALKYMSDKNDGYILNTASSAGLLPAGPYMATYYATKSYVVSLTRAVARELKENGSKVYVGALCPGPVDTEFNQVANVEFALKGITAKQCVSRAIKKMEKRQTIIIPEVRFTFVNFLAKLAPIGITTAMVSRQQKKKLDK